jgi:hypothetical protein
MGLVSYIPNQPRLALSAPALYVLYRFFFLAALSPTPAFGLGDTLP